MGGPDDIRDLRSLIPVALLCISSGGAMGPEAPTGPDHRFLRFRGVRGRWRLSGRRHPDPHHHGHGGRFHRAVRRPVGIGHLRPGDPAPAGPGVLRGAAPRGARLRSSATRVYVAITGVGLSPVWHFPAVGPHPRRRPAVGGGRGVGGAVVSVVFTYSRTGLALGVPPDTDPGPAGDRRGGARRAGLLVALRPDLRRGPDQPAAAHAGRGPVLVVAILAKLCGTAVTLSSGWRGGFIIPLFFIGVAPGRLAHLLVPSTNEVVMMAAFMAAINAGVTKTPLGSTLVVTRDGRAAAAADHADRRCGRPVPHQRGRPHPHPEFK